MSENNKIYVTTSSQTITANVSSDFSNYYSEKAQQYAEQSEASAQKSQANVDRLLGNEDFINVSQNLDLIVEAGQKIEGIDLEAILNAEASAKQSSESALASASLSEENAQTTTTNAQLSKTYRDESEEFSETSKNYMNNALSYKQEASTFRDLCYDISIETREQALDSQVYANNSLTYSNNAKTSETNALTYSNNAKTSETNALTYSNKAKGYLDEVKAIVPTNFTTLPIGSVISVNASANYTPSGFLPCDGSEYSKADFEKLWDNYLTGETYYAYYTGELEVPTIEGKTTITVYTKTLNLTTSDVLYELIDGEMIETTSGYSIEWVGEGYINVIYSADTENLVYVAEAYRNTTKDVRNSLLNTCTYTEYEQELATYGQCGKFAVKPLGYDGSGLTIVGSPSITEKGVISDCDSSNYLQIPNAVFSSIGNKTWKIEWGGNMPEASANPYPYVLGSNFQNTGSFINVGRFNNGANWFFNVVYNDNGTPTLSSAKYLATTAQDYNMPYSCYLEFTGSKYIMGLKTYTSTEYKTVEFATTNPLMPQSNNLNFCQNMRTGSIDLKTFKITVDGKTVFDCVEGDTFKVPTIEDTELGLKNFVVVSNGTVDDCLATWNTLVELENYLKGV